MRNKMLMNHHVNWKQNNLCGEKNKQAKDNLKQNEQTKHWRCKGSENHHRDSADGWNKRLEIVFERRTKSAQAERQWYFDHQISSCCRSSRLVHAPTHTHKHRSNLSYLTGWEWVDPKGTQVTISGLRPTNISPSASSPCWWWRQEIQEKVIRAQ